MKKLLIASTVAVATIVAAPIANAQPNNPVCSYLDAHPNIAGVEDVIGIAVAGGIDPYDAGSYTAQIVIEDCPRHLPTLQAYVAKWG